MRAAIAVVALLLAGCRDQEPQPPPAPRSLADYLTSIAGTDEANRTLEVAAWKLDEAAWNRIVVATYRGAHADYLRVFDARSPGLVAALASRGAIATRAHFAGDPKLTLGQAQTRWALPVQYPSEVAELDGVALDAVFVRDGDRWRAISGLEHVIRGRAETIDPTCAVHLEAARTGRCAEVGWVLAEAALLGDRARLAHACSLAANLCPR